MERGFPTGPRATVYLPARSTQPQLGASGTYHASINAYIDDFAFEGNGLDQDNWSQANSGFINSHSNTKYVGGQCQG